MRGSTALFVVSIPNDYNLFSASRTKNGVFTTLFLVYGTLMRKKLSKNKALAALKDIIQVKGPAFARMTGIPYDTLKSIESGRLAMSHDLAWKIRAATGVVPESIQPSSTKPLADWPDRGDYTAETFHHWRTLVLRKSNPRAAKEEAEKSAGDIAVWVRLLFLACAESRDRSTVWAFQLELGKCLDGLATQAELVEPINKMLKTYSRTDTLTLTGAEWKGAGMENIREAHKVTNRDLKRMADYESYSRQATFYPYWNPSGGVPDQARSELTRDWPARSSKTLPPRPA